MLAHYRLSLHRLHAIALLRDRIGRVRCQTLTGILVLELDHVKADRLMVILVLIQAASHLEQAIFVASSFQPDHQIDAERDDQQD